MNKYTIITDKIEVRSSTDKTNPQYIVRGYASIPNQLDWARFEKLKSIDGKYQIKSFRSLFTDNAVNSMKRQAKAKKVFVDAEHTLASEINTKHLIEQVRKEAASKGVNLETPVERVLDYLKHSEIPFAKVSQIEIDDKGLIIDTMLNPAFRDLSDDHKRYFDSVWSSLQNGFINGISINMNPTKVKEDYVGGIRSDIIDDVDLFGFSYTGQAALPENSIIEVAMRSAIEFREGKMETRNSGTTEIDVEKIKNEIRKETEERIRAEFDAKAQSEKIEREKAEQLKYIEDLKAKLESEKTAREAFEKKSGRIGVVNTDNIDISEETTKKNIEKLKVGECIGDPVLAGAAFDSYPEITRRAASKSSGDIIVARDLVHLKK